MQALDDILRTPLHDRDPGLSLSTISSSRKRAEMEFTFPVAATVGGRVPPLSASALASAFRTRDGLPQGYADRVAALGFAPLVGFLRGFIDLVFEHDGRYYVVDYKSNALEGRSPSEIIEAEYSLQRLVYALVCLRAGAEEVEVAYQFLERPEDVASTTFTTEDVPALESQLSAAIARIRAGEFRPTPSEFACSDCPALDLLCAGPRLATAR